MKIFLIILLIVCLAVQIPVIIFYLIHKKEIDKKADEEMKKKYPNWPYVLKQEETDEPIYGGVSPFF